MASGMQWLTVNMTSPDYPAPTYSQSRPHTHKKTRWSRCSLSSSWCGLECIRMYVKVSLVNSNSITGNLCLQEHHQSLYEYTYLFHCTCYNPPNATCMPLYEYSWGRTCSWKSISCRTSFLYSFTCGCTCNSVLYRLPILRPPTPPPKRDIFIAQFVQSHWVYICHSVLPWRLSLVTQHLGPGNADLWLLWWEGRGCGLVTRLHPFSDLIPCMHLQPSFPPWPSTIIVIYLVQHARHSVSHICTIISACV